MGRNLFCVFSIFATLKAVKMYNSCIFYFREVQILGEFVLISHRLWDSQ